MAPLVKRPTDFFHCIFFVFLCLNWPQDAKGQVSDDFSDGNFNLDPPWISSNESGDSLDFRVINEELNSNGPAAPATLWISTKGMSGYTAGQATWQFSCRFSAAPSGSNNVRVYLVSDSANLTQATRGFYIRMGERGSNDGIDLFSIGSSTPIIEDENPTVAAGIDVMIRVTRDADGSWQLEESSGGSGSFRLVGTGLETEVVLGEYFGFSVEHTSTRRDMFFFDDVSVNYFDNQPPRIIGVSVLDKNTLDITFSEPLETSSAIDANHYNVNNDIGRPDMVSLDPADPSKLRLVFGPGFASAVTNELSVSNVKDEVGNVLAEQTVEFLYFEEVETAWKEVIFSELMVNPSEPNDLPEEEFIEIFNKSDKVFDLDGWTVQDESFVGAFGARFLFPGEYLVLCASSNVQEFSRFGEPMGLTPFPTLNNDGDILTLRDPNGVLVDSISYDKSWLHGSTRTKGWTLELIDPSNECGEGDNWAVSEEDAGGTPGSQNSIFAEKPDLAGPSIVEIIADYRDSIRVRTNEKLDRASIFTATYDLGLAIEVEVASVSDDLKELVLTPSHSLEPGTLYELRVSDLLDCPGNRMQAQSLSFGLIEEPGKNDVLINEILFNPRGNGHDFVEIYNNSNKYINLRKLGISNLERDSLGLPQVINSRPISTDNIVMQPRTYLALTTGAEDVLNNYPRAPLDRIFEVDRLPSFSNSEGSVALVNNEHELIDYFEYDEDFHFELLVDREGVSLERITFDVETNSSHHWKSAASAVGYATPGYLNSQSIDNPVNTNGEVSIDPKVIIPGADGQNDFAAIRYRFDAPGKVANVRIFDLHGREILSLAVNEVLPTSGLYTWAGDDANGRKVRTGYYIVHFEVFDTDGSVRKFKEKVVVGTKF